MPAYFTNAGMLVVGGGKAIDNGYICKDGRRLFGPGKTWRGFLLGPLLIGIPISLGIHAALYYYWPNALSPYLNFMYGRPEAYILFDIGTESAVELYRIYLVEDWGILIIRVIVISYSASIGDLLGSWLKRRLNKNRGEPLWIVDQLDFVFVCLLFSLPFFPLDIFFLNIVIFAFLLSPTLTILANTLSYVMGIKSVPW
jgi:CDP-2,3-bis-(O-geranylgeranyl)-sn-glycerol synthase